MAIGDINVVAETTDTLTKMLSELDVTLDSPASLKDVNGSFEKINLYLYQVLEDPNTKNQPMSARDAHSLEYPPLTLNLYYLLTPYASDALSAHKVLGHAMRIFYDRALLSESELPDALRQVTDRLAIELLSAKLEDLTRIWNALQAPYRLSICYRVRIVPIESQRVVRTQRVLTRTDVYGRR